MRIVTVKKTNNIWIAPFMCDYSESEAKLITKCWELSGHEYIVDPLSIDQCLALMYDELPVYFKILFRKVERCDVEYEDYKRGFW